MSKLSTSISATTTKAKAKLKALDWCSIKTTLLWVFKTIGKIGAGAIVFVVLGNIAPELREQLPSFYRFIDFLISCIEWFYDKFWLIIDKF